LFGIKYILTIDNGTDLEAVTNDLALPIGFMANKDLLNQDISNLNCIDVQNKIFQSLSGISTPIFTEWDKEPSLINLSRETGEQFINYSTIDKSSSGYIIYDLPKSNDEIFYAYIDNLSYTTREIPNALYLITDSQLSYSKKDGPLLITNKYSNNPSKKLAITINDTFDMDNTKIIYQESKSAVSEHYAELADEPCDLQKINSAHLICTVDAKEDGNLFFTIPNDKGWTVKVDGEKVETKTAFDLFMTLPLSAGTHHVEMKYFPQGLKIGIWVSIFTLAGCTVTSFIRFSKRTKIMMATALSKAKRISK
jgi:uncharacterized membrane protein YfhO